MRHTIYLPDGLSGLLNTYKTYINLSSICQVALSKELDMVMAAIQNNEVEYERIETYLMAEERKVVFRGRLVLSDEDRDFYLYQTPKGALVLDREPERDIEIYKDFDDLVKRSKFGGRFLHEVAQNLGFEWIQELDI